jgi:murein DD-endopeptidase MepM/ murein hydrolase activator NlpD
MRSPRYTILIANRNTGSIRRLTVARIPLMAAIISVLSVPTFVGLAGLGARQSSLAEIQGLQTTNEGLRLENESYRAATGELAAQIDTLQTALTELTEQAQLDPQTRQAIQRLPPIVKSRAAGGGTIPPALIAPAGRSSTTPEGTFGILRDLLGVLEDRLASVKTRIEGQQTLAAATPSIWPVTGYLSSWFGMRKDPFTGQPDFHGGLDISANGGTPVRATADGEVESTGYMGNYGNAVMINHGFGIATRYGHLSGFAVRSGQRVKRGQVLGYVGATGRATSTHLHYEILLNGRPINPLNLLARP